tara:strand:+ start:1309 stop:2301 length:993 start_codon:yes stop_codon:yes gene_type:complete
MIFTNFFNKTYININSTFKSFNKLNLINKLFIVFLIFLFIIIVFNNIPNNYSLESFEGLEKEYENKIDEDVYDNFYCRYYDIIDLNKKRNEFELMEIKKISSNEENNKIIDLGCGTGYTVKIFKDADYNIVGLDKSEAMISKAESNYPNCEFIMGDILTNNIFDYNSYSHILCLGRTIYEIKDKETFFENCYSILSNNGFLIINLVDRDKFKPFVQNNDSNIVYNPEKYGKQAKEFIVKFDKNNEFISKYKVKNTENNNTIDSNITPYSVFNEKFYNFNTHATRTNERNLYMPEITKIINLAKSKDFELFKKINLKSIGYTNEYLYIFKK